MMTLNDKPVTNPLLYIACVLVLVFAIGVLLPLGILVAIFGLMLMVVVHPIFLLFGRRGPLVVDADGNIKADFAGAMTRRAAE